MLNKEADRMAASTFEAYMAMNNKSTRRSVLVPVVSEWLARHGFCEEVLVHVIGDGENPVLAFKFWRRSTARNEVLVAIRHLLSHGEATKGKPE
jgi:hypothetical protein